MHEKVVASQLAGSANDQGVNCGLLFEHKKGFRKGWQAFTLPDGVKSQALVQTQQLPIKGSDLPGLGCSRRVLAQKLLVILVIHETQILAFGCLRDNQTQALGDSPHFRLSQFTQGQ